MNERKEACNTIKKVEAFGRGKEMCSSNNIECYSFYAIYHMHSSMQ